VVGQKPITAVSGISIGDKVVSQTAAVVQNGGETVIKSEDDLVKSDKSKFSPWLYGVVGIVILALGFILAPKPIAASKTAADEYRIVED
jgi:hypothetical protein